MINSQAAKLQALTNRATRYELVLMHEDGRRVRLCYTARKNRRGLVDAIRRHGAELVAFTGASDFLLSADRYPSATLGLWRASFSGRTQRDAIQAGELRWFASQQENV